MPRDPLARVKARPNVDQWRDDEAMTLAEAVALFFPDGPLTLVSFRKAAKNGDLAVRRLLGKDFTTPLSVREMLKPCRGQPKAPDCTSASAPGAPLSMSSSTPAALSAARASALKTVQELRKR